MLEGFFDNLIFAIIARMLCGNHLNSSLLSIDTDLYFLEDKTRF